MMVCILTFEIHKEFTISIMVRSTKESSNMETRMAKVDNNSWQGIIWQLTRKKASENNFETISDFDVDIGICIIFHREVLLQ